MTANIKVINDVPRIPGKNIEGPGSWTDLVASKQNAEKPIAAGIWHLSDITEPTPAWEAEWDEVKYVVKGELVVKNEHTGETFVAKGGSFIWIPMGSKMSIISSKDVVAIYIEQRPGALKAEGLEAATKTT